MTQDYINLISLLFVLGVLTYALYTLLFTSPVLSCDGAEQVYLIEGSPNDVINSGAKIATLEQVTSEWAKGTRWTHGAYIAEGRCVELGDTINTTDQCTHVAVYGAKLL